MSEPLFSAERAEATYIREWLKRDVELALLGIRQGRFSRDHGLQEVIAAGMLHAERAKMTRELGRTVAIGMFRDAIAEWDEERRATLAAARARWGTKKGPRR